MSEKRARCLVHFPDETSEILDMSLRAPRYGTATIVGRTDPVWNVTRMEEVEPADGETGVEFEIWVSEASEHSAGLGP